MKKLLIWGTGTVAELFLKEIIDGEVVGFIESKITKKQFYDKTVYLPEYIDNIDFDVLIIASSFTEEICNKCNVLNIDNSKIVYLRNFQKILSFNGNEALLREIVNEKYYKDIFNKSNCIILNRMQYDSINPTAIDLYNAESYQYDYCRYRTFELVGNEIEKAEIKGAIAEIGVNVGTFARIINHKFPDRTFYLFDTFDSFNIEEFENEVKEGNCDEGFIKEFKSTSTEVVIKNMPNPNVCVIKKGLFPGTAKGLDERFAFVSIDVDFEQSIYHSLEYFYPRMNDGGYIFIHDFNNNFLFGVKKAVEKFENKYGFVKKVPIADNSGTLIIVK